MNIDHGTQTTLIVNFGTNEEHLSKLYKEIKDNCPNMYDLD